MAWKTTIRFLSHLLLISLLHACTTMKVVEDVGGQYSKGNIVMGTLGILAVPGAMVIDVFTLGGTLSANEAAGTWGAGISTYAAIANKNESGHSYAPSTSTSNYQASPTFSSRTNSANQSVAPETSAQLNVGNASQVGRGSSSGSGRTMATGNNSNSKFQSKDATHCVEIVPRGFKGCTYKRCVHNACGLETISVWWDGGMIDLSPGRNWPVNPLVDNGGPVTYNACSWDKRAGYSPSRNPCRYN